MTIRIIASGSDLMAFLREGTGPYTYRPIAAQNGASLTYEDNDRETNAKNLGGPVDYFNGLEKYSISVETEVVDPLDINAAEVSFDELIAFDLAGTKIDIVLVWVTHNADTAQPPVPDTTRPSYLGRYKIKAPMEGASGENVTSSITGKGCQIKLSVIAGIPAT